MPRLIQNETFVKTRNFKKSTHNLQVNNTQTHKPIYLKDMIEMLEISANARKMLHAPTLRVFILKTISKNAEQDKSRLYEILNSWKKGSLKSSSKLMDFESVFYDSKLNFVHLCTETTGAYPFKAFIEIIQSSDVQLIKYFAVELLSIYKTLDNLNISVDCVKLKNIVITSDFSLKLDFIKKARLGNNTTHNDKVFYCGLLVMKLAFKGLTEGLHNLIYRSLGSALFASSCDQRKTSPDIGFIFDTKGNFIKLSSSFMEQNCCYLHFLLGQKRVMIKNSFVEMVLEKKSEIYSEIKQYRSLIRKMLAQNEDFENYFCFTTRFDREERLNLDQCIKHQFLLSFDAEQYKEKNQRLLDSFINIFIRTESENVPQFFARGIYKMLTDYYKKWTKEFVLPNPFNSPRYSNELALGRNDPTLQFLAFELGVTVDSLLVSLEQIINCPSHL